ncbi:hypothetical protein [Nonomuraea sp. NPDC001699]
MNEEARTGRSPGPWKAVVTGLGLVLATISAVVGILSFLGDEAERAEARRDRARTSPAVQQPEPAPTVSPKSLELAETLTSGTGCTPEGNIALDRHANGTLTYNYFHTRGAVTTTGTLKKTGN